MKMMTRSQQILSEQNENNENHKFERCKRNTSVQFHHHHHHHRSRSSRSNSRPICNCLLHHTTRSTHTSTIRRTRTASTITFMLTALFILLSNQIQNISGFLIRQNGLHIHSTHPFYIHGHKHYLFYNNHRGIKSSSIENNVINNFNQYHEHNNNMIGISGISILAATKKGKSNRTKSDDEYDDDGENNDMKKPKYTSISKITSKSTSSSSSPSTSTSTSGKNFTIPEINLYKKRKQIRRKLKHPRRPSSFWADLNNIESELRKFWKTLNVPISPKDPPPIPNEALLNHFERNDLRYAIANMGGRESVSMKLNGAKLIPGKWTQAVITCKEVQYLLHPSNPAGKGLSEDVPPIAPYIKRTLQRQRLAMKKKQKMRSKEQEGEGNYDEMVIQEGGDVYKNIDVDKYFVFESKNRNDSVESNDVTVDEDCYDDIDIDIDIDSPIEKLRFMGGQRWAHSSARNPRGHWSMNVIIQELYQYLTHVKEEKGRPSVWMPRPSELATEGRNDLKQAMVRFGGSAKTCQLAKLVPYREWRYFESSLELYVELLKYLVKFHNGSEKVFPKLADIQANGHERLYDLIMEYGGRKLIAAKLDMEFQAQTKLDLFKDMSYGPFSLDFAVRLLSFIRNDMMEKDPPLEKAYIQMPTRQYLLSKGEERLVSEISKYGGHESIARRLNLVFDGYEATREATKMLLEE